MPGGSKLNRIRLVWSFIVHRMVHSLHKKQAHLLNGSTSFKFHQPSYGGDRDLEASRGDASLDHIQVINDTKAKPNTKAIASYKALK